MRKLTLFTTLLAAGLTLTGCAGMSNQDTGTLAGATIGGLLGSRFGGGSGRVVTTMLGTFAGALIGGRIGASMDQNDRARLNQTLENNRTGQTRSWVNPDNNRRYRVTPTRTYKDNGRNCRHYKMTAIIDGKAEIIHGKACRNAKGIWVKA